MARSAPCHLLRHYYIVQIAALFILVLLFINTYSLTRSNRTIKVVLVHNLAEIEEKDKSLHSREVSSIISNTGKTLLKNATLEGTSPSFKDAFMKNLTNNLVLAKDISQVSINKGKSIHSRDVSLDDAIKNLHSKQATLMNTVPSEPDSSAPTGSTSDALNELVQLEGTEFAGTISPVQASKGLSLSRKGKIKTHYYTKYWRREPEVLVENSERTPRDLTPYEKAGNNIMLAIKTVQPHHRTRIQLSLNTWISVVNASNVFMVTNASDAEYEAKARNIGFHYVEAMCNTTHSWSELCCKTGVELSLMSQPQNRHYDWLCHIDDDAYLYLDQLIQLLSLYDPKTEPVYLGQSYVQWTRPKYLNAKQILFLQRRLRYHYAMGVIYCISRPMITKLDPWIGNAKKMMEKCHQLKADDDKVIGIAVELLLGERLARTKKLVRYGIKLSKVTLDEFASKQVAVMYGCDHNPHCAGVFKDNSITIPYCPNPTFTTKEDPTRLKSLHCCLYHDLHPPMCDEATVTAAESFHVCESERRMILDKVQNDTSPMPFTHGVMTPEGKVLMKWYYRYWNYGDERLAETSGRIIRNLTRFEQAGNNIMFTIKTTRSYHRTRVQVLLDTWTSVVNASNVFLVTDGNDEEYEAKLKHIGMHYVKAKCNSSYDRLDLCCKTGEELSLMFRPENSHYDWLCHLDDDIYIHYKKLHNLLSLFDPKEESIYFGQSWRRWQDPQFLHPNQTLFVNKTLRYHYAMGGIYCLSRPQLMKVRPWIGDTFKMIDMCKKLHTVEDQTIGIAVELLTGGQMTRTKSYVPHGCRLSIVSPEIFSNHIGVMYGCGQNLACAKKYKNNMVSIPFPAFSVTEDPTRFKSVHCYLYPQAPLCGRNASMHHIT